MKYTATLQNNSVFFFISQACIDNSVTNDYNCTNCDIEFIVGDSLNSMSFKFNVEVDSLLAVTRAFDSCRDSIILNGNSIFQNSINQSKRLDSNVFVNKTYKWNLIGSDSSRIVNSMNLYKIERGVKTLYGSVKIAKESDEYLNERFGIDVQNGCLVLERNTCLGRLEPNVEDREMYSDSTKNINGKAEIAKLIYKDSVGSLNLETDFEIAIKSTQKIWNIMSKTGPSNKVKPEMSVLKILSLIQDSGATIQCQGTRDLVYDILITMKPESKANIRKVDLHRCNKWKGMTNNTHALLEIYENDKWVVFDPFVRAYFTPNQNEKLSVKEIQKLKLQEKLYVINVNFIETRQPNVHDFNENKNPFDSYNYNYFSVFNKIIYHK